MPQSWIGKTIGGRYHIESLLGQGGMSAVYRATDPNLRRMVAVKLIHTHLAVNPRFVDRFKEEAAAIARLRHPNIVQVHDFSVDDGTYYMVMEYLSGETLQARLRRLNSMGRQMSLAEVVDLGSQLCDALRYAHDHELIHRDVKPANVMLDMHGQAILMDFGIVKIIGGEYHTATGATIGTANYMSPEQIRSERADERSDIYSLGVTLYEMISGRTPYEADSSLSLMMMVLNDPLPDLREWRQGIPESLSALVEKALAKDKLERFQTMAEMASALQQITEDEIQAPAAETVVDDDPARQAGATAQPPDAPIEPEPAAVSGGAKPAATGPASPPDARRLRISAIPTQLDTAPESNGPLSKAREEVGRNYRLLIVAAALIALVGLAAGGYLQLRAAPAVLITGVEHPQTPINAETAPVVVSLARWETNAFIEELAISPDGRVIGTANNRESKRLSPYRFYGSLWSITGDTPQQALLGHSAWVYSVDFSPDGQFVATASEDGKVIVWRLEDGSQTRTIETALGGLSNVDFSPGNSLLAAGTWGGSVGLWQLPDGHLLRRLEGHTDSVTDVEFSPDGTLIASASDDHAIGLWQVSDGSLVHTLSGHTASVRKLAFSAEGALLASASDDGTVRLWRVRDGSAAAELLGHSEPVLDVAFTTDGSLLASGSGDGTVRLWRAADGELLSNLTEHENSITSLAFTPDSHLLVSAASDGVLRFWGLSEAIAP